MSYEEQWRRLTPQYETGEAKAIVRLVMEECCGLSLADILCGKVDQLPTDLLLELERLFRKIEEGSPVQYVLGEATFCGRQLKVTPAVLIPRPETEELCRWVTEEQNCRVTSDRQAPLRVLDVGTGSGCIAVTLALDITRPAEVTAWDISTEALDVARENALRLKASVDFRQCDALLLPDDHDCWDIIVSNPPYVCASEAAAMAPHVLNHEPHQALFVPDGDPLRFYRAISRYAAVALRPGGRLYFELNPSYADEVAIMLQDLGMNCVELRRDQFGKVRMVRGERTVSSCEVRE